MTEQKKLPRVNQYGYFEIRLESIGGLGANLCGKLLGELGATALGLNAASFSSYGSEKRGSPVKAFIRWTEGHNEVRSNSPVEKPHILGIFHENLAGREDVTAGIEKDSVVIINTDRTAADMVKKFQLPPCRVVVVDALKIAMEEKSRVNMVMLGAVAKACGFVALEDAVSVVNAALLKKYPALSERNKQGVLRGYEEGKEEAFGETGFEKEAYHELKEVWGYDNAPLGGVNPIFGSTVSNDLSGSREGYLPKFIKDKCINCGLCDTACPDMVYQFVKGEYKGKEHMVNMGPDYKHCKGCLRCVEVCPTHALVEQKEREYDVATHHIRNQDLIVSRMEFDETGANSWVTSDSFLEERHVDSLEAEK